MKIAAALCAAALLAACGDGGGHTGNGSGAAEPMQRATKTTRSAALDEVGEWSQLGAWPMIPIHGALLADGRVVTFGTDDKGKVTGYLTYDVWDPAAGGPSQGHLTLPNGTGTDLFCAAQTLLPSGELFIAGGDTYVGGYIQMQGNSDTTHLDPRTRSLTSGPKMKRPRWYATLTTLPDATIYVHGGLGGEDRPEVRETGGTTRLLTDVDTSDLDWWYPRNFLSPDHRVFGFDTRGQMYYVSPLGAGSHESAGSLGAAAVGRPSQSTLFSPGRILTCGAPHGGCLTIDINGPRPVLRATGSLSTPRQWGTATVLPDGRVLLTGGAVYNSLFTRGSPQPNDAAELWDPATGEWRAGARAGLPRLYHSIAMLLPDATVLVGGGGSPGPYTNLNAEIYRPPYLFQGNSPATRPVIANAPDVMTPGAEIAISVAPGSDAARLTLVRNPSVTHSLNMDSGFLELPFRRDGDTLHATLPANGADVAPGFYMIFVLDSRDTPSVAKIARMNVAPSLAPMAPWTPEQGGGDGKPYQLECADGQALVGLHGQTGPTAVARIAPLCATVDATGRWSGDPEAGDSAGDGGGSEFDVRCPRDAAVAGWRGMTGGRLSQIALECRPLMGQQTVTGAGHWIDPIGPGGGGAHGPDACAGDRAAWAIYGRNGTAIDSLGLLCRRGVHGLNVEPVAGPETVVAPVTAGEGSRWLSKLQPGAGFHVWTDTPSDCPIGMTGNGIEVPRTAYADAAAPLCSAR